MSFYDFHAPMPDSLEAAEHYSILQQSLGFSVVPVVHQESVEYATNSIVFEAPPACFINRNIVVSEPAVSNGSLPRDCECVSHEFDIFRKKQSSHTRSCKQLYPTSTINLSQVRKVLAWQSRFMSWIANLILCQCVQCYHVNCFGSFMALRRNIRRRLYFYIVNISLEFASERFTVPNLCYIPTATAFVEKYLNFQLLPAEVLSLFASNVFITKWVFWIHVLLNWSVFISTMYKLIVLISASL